VARRLTKSQIVYKSPVGPKNGVNDCSQQTSDYTEPARGYTITDCPMGLVGNTHRIKMTIAEKETTELFRKITLQKQQNVKVESLEEIFSNSDSICSVYSDESDVNDQVGRNFIFQRVKFSIFFDDFFRN